METGLALIETTTAALLFTPTGLEPILQRIEKEAIEEAAKLDISTAANRKSLNSLSFKVIKSKTFLEAARLKAKADAEEAVRKREEDHLRHEESIRVAAEKAEREKNEAIEAERERVAAEKRREDAEVAAREANKKHKASLNSAAVHALAVECYIAEENARLVITAIALGKIPNVKMVY